MNIGIVCYPTFGGSGVIATELGKALAQKGHNVHFITYDRPVRLDIFAQNIFYHEVRTPSYPLFEHSPYESALTSQIVHVAKYYDLDLLHVHYAIPHASAAFFAREILKSFGIYLPFITTLHGTDITLVGKEETFESVVKFSIEQSDGITSVSDFLKEETFSRLEVNKAIEVIPNFVDLKRFRKNPQQMFRQLVAPNGEKIIVHTSNFRKVKRIEDVLKMFLLVKQKLASKLILVGDGPERSHMEKFARDNQMTSCVHFLGKQDKIEDIMGLADLFVMPSESESFGLAALEAMACAVPVVATNVGGLPEVVDPGVNGYLCEVGDVEDMAQKALEILQNPEIQSSYSSNALLKAQSFDIEKIVVQYENYYSEILNKVKTNFLKN